MKYIVLFSFLTTACIAMQKDSVDLTAAGQLLILPNDVKNLIWNEVVEDSVKNLARLARTNKALHQFSYNTYLNNPAHNGDCLAQYGGTALKVVKCGTAQMVADEIDVFQKLREPRGKLRRRLITDAQAEKISKWLYRVRVPQIVLEKVFRKTRRIISSEDRMQQRRQLVALGVNVNGTDKGGRTALYKTCLRYPPTYDSEPMRQLLTFNPLVNKASKDSKTPLMVATLFLNVEKVRLLLEAGADWRMRDVEGKTAFDWALEMSVLGDTVLEFLKSPRIPLRERLCMVQKALLKPDLSEVQRKAFRITCMNLEAEEHLARVKASLNVSLLK